MRAQSEKQRRSDAPSANIVRDDVDEEVQRCRLWAPPNEYLFVYDYKFSAYSLG